MKIERIVNNKNQLTIDLFHGTSTLFLDSIVQNGLGGINPISQWNVLELSKEVLELSEEHLKENEIYVIKSFSFRKMIEQSNEGMFNFQHGQTYLSPSRDTASSYAINKEFGSELLTYTLILLKELININIKYVTTDLFRRYPRLFGLIDAKPSPLLIQVKNVNISNLTSEHGEDPKFNLDQMQQCINESKEHFQSNMQQTNFRLTAPIEKNNLKLWLINVQEWHNLVPKYNFYEIVI